MTITAAADGSALGNPGPAGWAWYVNDDCWRAGGWPHGTNNQGELMAVLDLLRATAHLPGEDLRILCDSQYVINSITKWMPGWKRKGWRKADGKPVLNMELLKELDRELAGRTYTFEWVKGHAGHDLNEAADERARAAATAYQQGVAARSGPGFPGGHHPGAQHDLSRGQNGREPALHAQAPSGVGLPPATLDIPGTAPAQTPAVPRESARPGAAGGAAARPAAPSTGVPAGGANQRRSVPEPVPAFDELDLFSELDDEALEVAEATQRAGSIPPEALVEELERELLGPLVRGDIGRTAVLLHPDFMEIGSSGRVWTRDAMMMALEEDPGERTDIEILGADRIGTSAVLLTYRSFARSGTTLRSSLWVLDSGRWRLRFHQGTPEA
ncbi:ribonuclease HI [Arthrobacter oryzae]|uniref:ribonuclease HI family protein n=1 Tax=Arthrobacter TaxID=1663 RepID=UPI001F22CAEB|nr:MULTISPECIES: ribonuclease HI family protein [Arthrobacter]MDP9987694.1 ribonuclease HI [Arthrobacter oryzae]UKA72017.1 ribonuclease HI family protein [Arthrobacter sp. FW306-06-A]